MGTIRAIREAAAFGRWVDQALNALEQAYREGNLERVQQILEAIMRRYLSLHPRVKDIVDRNIWGRIQAAMRDLMQRFGRMVGEVLDIAQ
jgi:hypothetical protein